MMPMISMCSSYVPLNSQTVLGLHVVGGSCDLVKEGNYSYIYLKPQLGY